MRKGIQYILIYLLNLTMVRLTYIANEPYITHMDIWASIVVAAGLFVVALISDNYYSRVVFVESIDDMENASTDIRARRVVWAILGVAVSVLVCIELLALLQDLVGFETTILERVLIASFGQLAVLIVKVE